METIVALAPRAIGVCLFANYRVMALNCVDDTKALYSFKICLLFSVQAHRAVRHIAGGLREGKAQDGGGQGGRGTEAARSRRRRRERGGDGQEGEGGGGGAAKGLRHSGDPGGVGARVGALVAQPRAQEYRHLGDTHLPHVRAIRVRKVDCRLNIKEKGHGKK